MGTLNSTTRALDKLPLFRLLK